jgi:hypothetical protein
LSTKRPIFQQPDGNGIRFLAGRARRGPNPDRAIIWLCVDDLGEKAVRQAPELMILAVKIGFVDRERVYQMLDFIVGVGP